MKILTPQLMVKENDRIREMIPPVFAPLMTQHLERLDEVLSPGLTLIRWSAMNFEAFLSSSNKAVRELEQVTNAVIGIDRDRIQVVFKDMRKTQLCEISATETVEIEEFCSVTSALCSAAATHLDSRSQVVEEAVRELVGLLFREEVQVAVPADSTTPGAASTLRRFEQRQKLQQEAENVTLYYEQENANTLLQLVRATLEGIRRRLAVNVYGDLGRVRESQPVFSADIVLSVPSVTMKPTLEDLQKGLNQAVQCITAVMKCVFQWGQERPKPPPIDSENKPIYTRSDFRSRSRTFSHSDSLALKNYYRPVSEHKEVQKLVSALSSVISSTKMVITTGLERFGRYSDLWMVEQQDRLSEFMEGSPTVGDFQAEMQRYSRLEEEIMTESDLLPVGTVALSSEQVKLALCTEAKAWRVFYGRSMNETYQAVMEDVFKSIDEWSRQLGRPLKDLDDIRFIMATLKDIRENEIRIDMALEPIEVSGRQWCVYMYMYVQ